MNSVPTPVVPQYIHGQIAQIINCPCSPSTPFGISSFRAVHSDIQHANNFLPKAVLEPNLLTGATPSKACGLWGLSMYETPQALRDMVSRVERTVPAFRKKIGDHYAEMSLTFIEGVRTPSNKTGHFDFYAYENCNYHMHVVSVQAI